jgi:hypothetical protein
VNQSGSAFCGRCKERPWECQTITVLGPLNLAESFLCRTCIAIVDAEVRPPLGNDLDHLGPIEFEVLRASFARIDEYEADELAVLPFCMSAISQIAAAHNQVLPSDIQAMVERYSE